MNHVSCNVSVSSLVLVCLDFDTPHGESQAPDHFVDSVLS